MYLSELSSKQKELFLDICVSLSKTDNNFAEEEKRVIQSLCEEMNIVPKYETEKASAESLCEISAISTEREKRIIFIELLGIVMADKKIATEEESFMYYVLDIFKINRSELKVAVDLVNELYDVYEKFANFLDR